MSTWRGSIAHSRDSALACRAGGPDEQYDQRVRGGGNPPVGSSAGLLRK